jgi:hypothetical protein
MVSGDHERPISAVMERARVPDAGVDPCSHDLEDEEFISARKPCVGHATFETREAVIEQWSDYLRRRTTREPKSAELVDAGSVAVAAADDLAGKLGRRNVQHALP